MLANVKDFCGFVAGGAEGNRTPDLCSAIARNVRVLADFSSRALGTSRKPNANAARTSCDITAELPHVIGPKRGCNLDPALTTTNIGGSLG